MQTATTIRLDDLQPGNWYRFTLPIGVTAEGQWLGFDGLYGLFREEGSLRAEPWPCNLLAASEISAMPAPCEIIDVPIESPEENLPLTPRERRWIGLAIVAGMLFWGNAILWLFGR